MHGFLLGLANGVTCLAYCAPVLVPFLLGEGRKVGQNYAVLGQFLAGRLGGYLLFGLFAWAANLLIAPAAPYRGVVFGCAYILLAGLLVIYGLSNRPAACAQEPLRGLLAKAVDRWPALFPASSGFLTGLSLCPPFLLAFTEAANTGSLGGSLLLFLMFFLGTCLYFIPMPFLGALSRFPSLRIIGKLTALIVALYYLLIGIAALGGGINRL